MSRPLFPRAFSTASILFTISAPQPPYLHEQHPKQEALMIVVFYNNQDDFATRIKGLRLYVLIGTEASQENASQPEDYGTHLDYPTHVRYPSD